MKIKISLDDYCAHIKAYEMTNKIYNGLNTQIIFFFNVLTVKEFFQ
jgi:hypothetical protein